MTGGITLGAALMLGFAASGHCLAMCGGISGALGMASARSVTGRPRTSLLLAYQVGRLLSYAIAGGLLGGALGFVVGWLDVEAVRTAMRAASAFALIVAALVVLGLLRDPGSRIGRLLWPHLAPLGRRLLPVTGTARALGFGMVWGWMPCGFAYTVMLIAALEQDALRSAVTMLAFGIGTAPAMLAIAFGARSATGFAAGTAGRGIAGGMLIATAVLTLFAGDILVAAPWMQPWMPFLCNIEAQ